MNQTALRHLWPLLALALLVWGAPATAQSGAAMLRVEPESLSLTAGQTQTVAIVIEDAAEVYGIDVRAGFDPALVEIVDADPARDGVQMTAGVFPQPDFVALNAADNSAGALRYAVTQVNPTPPASGGGAVVTFQVLGRANGVSPLRLTLVEMANRSGELLPVTTRDGAITVTGGQPPAPTGVALTVPAEGGPPTGAGVATAAPTVAAEATTAAAATVAPAATVAADNATPAPTVAPANPIARETTGPAGNPTAPPESTDAGGATVVPGATAAPSDETAEVIPEAIAGQTTTDLEAATVVGNAGDTSAESAASPSVIGAGTDMAGPTASPTSPANGSPGGALLIGGVVVLVLVAAVILLARRGRG